MPVIHLLKRIEVHVPSVPSGFAFESQCSLWKEIFHPLLDFIQRGQGQGSLTLIFCPLDFPLCFLNGKLAQSTVPKNTGA